MTFTGAVANQPQAPMVLPIDTTRLEIKNTIPTNNMNYICIECNERGHKYKDCPKVAENKNKQETDNKSDENKAVKYEDKKDKIQSLKDDGLDRIPKKTDTDISNTNTPSNTKPNTTPTTTTSTSKQTITTTPSVLNPNLLRLNKYNLALISANKALEFDVNCLGYLILPNTLLLLLTFANGEYDGLINGSFKPSEMASKFS